SRRALPVRFTVTVIALDASLRSGDQRREEKTQAPGNEPRPEPPQPLRAVYAQHLTAAADRLPRFASDRRLDDDGKADAGIGRSRTGRANPARGRDRQGPPPPQRGETRPFGPNLRPPPPRGPPPQNPPPVLPPSRDP